MPLLSVIILSFNRREALRHTLTQVTMQAWSHDAQIIVVDNASADGSAAMVRADFPNLELIALDRNTAIDGFNIGASHARGDILLILDDDSWPQPGSIEAALRALRDDPTVGGVMLHRQHPRGWGFEWPFDRTDLIETQHMWPDMGCGNLIRADIWKQVEGYESGFFLYRNDTDLALKILNAGFDVLFNPAWRVWHDSFIVVRKSNRWLHLSTRNWLWMCRRHARGTTGMKAMLLGYLHAHRLAGWRFTAQLCTIRGGIEGLVRRHPPLPASVPPPKNSHMQRLLTLKMRYRR